MISAVSLKAISHHKEVLMKKFVFNKEKNDEQRRMLMMTPTIEEAEALVKEVQGLQQLEEAQT